MFRSGDHPSDRRARPTYASSRQQRRQQARKRQRPSQSVGEEEEDGSRNIGGGYVDELEAMTEQEVRDMKSMERYLDNLPSKKDIELKRVVGRRNEAYYDDYSLNPDYEEVRARPRSEAAVQAFGKELRARMTKKRALYTELYGFREDGTFLPQQEKSHEVELQKSVEEAPVVRFDVRTCDDMHAGASSTHFDQCERIASSIAFAQCEQLHYFDQSSVPGELIIPPPPPPPSSSSGSSNMFEGAALANEEEDERPLQEEHASFPYFKTVGEVVAIVQGGSLKSSLQLIESRSPGGCDTESDNNSKSSSNDGVPRVRRDEHLLIFRAVNCQPSFHLVLWLRQTPFNRKQPSSMSSGGHLDLGWYVARRFYVPPSYIPL